jgi:glutathione reductase (NADPH)
MAEYDFDLFTIGAGSGGVRASRMAASMGARVAVAEESRVGGTCVLRGCVPKKLMVMASHFAEDFADAAGFGWSVGPTSIDWPAFIATKDKELDRLNGIYIRLLRDAGVTLVEGRAVVIDDNTVEVAGRRYTANRILIATGGWPSLPQIPGIELAMTSNEILELPQLPKRLAIVGGGYIAVEFAGIFAALGVAVSLVVRGDTLLRGFDQDLRASLAEEMTKKGVTILRETKVGSIERCPEGDLSLQIGGALETEAEDLRVDAVLYATGRKPNTKGLGLPEIGVRLDETGAIVVDQFSRSSVESIYAVGDCTDRVNLTPVAIAEARCVVETLFNHNPTVLDYTGIPSAVFSQPPIGTVGLTEAEARKRYGEIDVYISRFRPMRHTLSGRDERTMMKLVVKRDDQKVVGCHMIGADSPEIVQGLAVALKCGATKAQFDATIGIHPTAAEEFVTMREKQPEPHPVTR